MAFLLADLDFIVIILLEFEDLLYLWLCVHLPVVRIVEDLVEVCGGVFAVLIIFFLF